MQDVLVARRAHRMFAVCTTAVQWVASGDYVSARAGSPYPVPVVLTESTRDRLEEQSGECDNSTHHTPSSTT